MERKFGRLGVDVDIRYKFIGREKELPQQEVHVGKTRDISSVGLSLECPLPGAWVLEGLIKGEVFVGLNIILPNRETPIKALARLIWIEVNEKEPQRVVCGLKFVTIDKGEKDDLVRFSIRSQIRRF